MTRLTGTMTAVQLVGHGGPEKLIFRDDVPIPVPGTDEVLIQVAAAGVNNTDINTRIGWYSKKVKEETNTVDGSTRPDPEDATWSGSAMAFPRIQGADCCGWIVDVGSGVSPNRIGARVIVRNMLRSYVGYQPYACWTLGSEVDGAFAQFVKAPSQEAFAIDTALTDVELAAIPCAYSTAEGALHRASVKQGDKVLVTGASGGVGLAAVQLARLHGASVTAMATESKAAIVKSNGADRVIDRDADLVSALGRDSIDVVIDVVAGTQWPRFLDVLNRGGRYAVVGAIGGPLVELDVRTLYLKDLTFFGCTFQEDVVFENLVSYVEKGLIRPVISKTYPLQDIATAQRDFVSKKFPGKLVLVPPPFSSSTQ